MRVLNNTIGRAILAAIMIGALAIAWDQLEPIKRENEIREAVNTKVAAEAVFYPNTGELRQLRFKMADRNYTCGALKDVVFCYQEVAPILKPSANHER